MKSNTEQDYRKRIARVIEAIILDPTAPHTIESLAAIAHFSPFHFHRLYRALTGESVAATVRRVRLAQAAHLLAKRNGSVTDVAFETGYDSSQSFARAFRELTGMSPSGFQATQQAMPHPPKAMPTELPAMTLLAWRHQGPPSTIRHSWHELRRHTSLQSLDWRDVTRVGVCYGDPDESDGFRYWAGLLLREPFHIGDDLEQVEIPGGIYATHRLIGVYDLIAPTFQTLFGGWLPRSGFVPDDRPALEFYHNAPSTTSPAALETDLFIPIRKA